MPASKRTAPEFSPYGRYLINVQDRKVEGATFFHDTQNIKVECGVEAMPSNSISRFNGRAWAIERGFQPCMMCRL